MSIQGTELRRPMSGPVRTGRPARAGAHAPSTQPSGRRFDAAEVRGGRPEPPRGMDTEEALGRLHESGLLEKVSRPLTQNGQRTAEEELAMVKHSIDRMGELRPIPPEARRAPDAELRIGRPGGGPRGAEPMREPPTEGRVYGRPRPQGPEAAPRDDGMFTMRLFSPEHDTGRVLRIGDYEIPVEEDGSILAGMPDGTVRRITINQDVMDDMVAKGQVWLNGERVMPRKAADIGIVAGEKAESAAEEAADEQSTPAGKAAETEITARSARPNAALVSQLKADLERRQRQMLDMVRDMLGEQGKRDVWRTLASGKFKADSATIAEAKKNISDDGYWGVEQTSDRIVQFAVGLTGGDPSKLDTMIEAFEKGYAEAEKKWGGALPSICQSTRQRVHEKFEELRKEYRNRTAAAE